jgi:hypothetical protein
MCEWVVFIFGVLQIISNGGSGGSFRAAKTAWVELLALRGVVLRAAAQCFGESERVSSSRAVA